MCNRQPFILTEIQELCLLKFNNFYQLLQSTCRRVSNGPFKKKQMNIRNKQSFSCQLPSLQEKEKKNVT